MGKRELLIAIVFVVIGAAVYQLTAPATKHGEGFSFSRLWNNARRAAESDRASAKTTTQLTVPVTASLREVRVTDIHGGITITGEARADIAVEFAVQSTGPDGAQALAYARSSKLKVDTLGDAMTLSGTYPTGGRQVAALTLKVPKRLAIRLEGGTGIRVIDVDTLKVMGGSGGGTLSGIVNGITGDMRGGTIEISDAGPLSLTLTTAQSTITKVHGTMRLDVRSGRCKASEVTGDVEIDTRQAEIDLAEMDGTVRVGGQGGGHVHVAGPRAEVRIDIRRSSLAVELTRAVPLRLSTTDGNIDLRLADGLAIDLDAAATDGEIAAGDWQLQPTQSNHDTRLSHTWGKAALVTVRTSRGDITIKKIGR
jgi:hypothetical protein